MYVLKDSLNIYYISERVATQSPHRAVKFKTKTQAQKVADGSGHDYVPVKYRVNGLPSKQAEE